jgi:hypothetical protein
MLSAQQNMKINLCSMKSTLARDERMTCGAESLHKAASKLFPVAEKPAYSIEAGSQVWSARSALTRVTS